MITWNKGEPPKDGEIYLVVLEEKNGSCLERWADEAQWYTNSKWLSFGSFIGKDTSIVAWSEINLPEES